MSKVRFASKVASALTVRTSTGGSAGVDILLCIDRVEQGFQI